MTFQQFCIQRDKWIAEVADGMTADDFADACWRDLYDDLGEEVTKEDVFAELAEWDDIFQQMLETQGIEY